MPLISRAWIFRTENPRVAEDGCKEVRNLHERTTDHRVRPLRRRTDQSGMGSRKAMKDEIAGATITRLQIRPSSINPLRRSMKDAGAPPGYRHQHRPGRRTVRRDSERVAINVTDARNPG